MPILWYPGHMVAARKDAVEAMRRTDLVIEVLDARVPHASLNPMVATLRKENRRPALMVLNKSDLADPVHTRAWLDRYNAEPEVKAIAVSAKKPGEVERIIKAARALVPGRGTAAKPLRMMILGVPNVGKSTLMNALLKRRIAAVGDQPGITKTQVGHAIGPGLWLIDTPGLLWPGVGQDHAVKLAAVHSIGRNAFDDVSVAENLAQFLVDNYLDLVERRFGVLARGCDGHGLVAWIAQARRFLLQDGVPDLNKAAAVLLNEFRAGTLGRITLEH